MAFWVGLWRIYSPILSLKSGFVLFGDNSKDYLGNGHNNDAFLTPPWLIQTPLLHRQYLVLVPSSLYIGVPEKACIMLNHLNETVTLNVILEYGTQNKSLLTDLVTEDSSYCSPLIVSISLLDNRDHWRKDTLVDALYSDPKQLKKKKHNEKKWEMQSEVQIRF